MIDSKFPTLLTIEKEITQLFKDQIEKTEVRGNLLIVKIGDIEYYIKKDDFYEDENRHRLSCNDRERNLFISDIGHLSSIRNYFKKLYEETNQFNETPINQINHQLIKLLQDQNNELRQKADMFDKIINEYFNKELYVLDNEGKHKCTKQLGDTTYDIIHQYFAKVSEIDKDGR